MLRNVVAVAAGLAVWMLVVLAASVVIRASWPEYVRVAEAMTFTMPMKLVRLGIGAVATLAAGAAAAAVGGTRAAATVAGAVLLVAFIPQHIALWQKFPVWYHLAFLGSLVPFSMIGSRFTRG